MPREIIHVQVGQCGNQVGQAFVKSLIDEHNIQGKDAENPWSWSNPGFVDTDGDGMPDELENIDVYFERTLADKPMSKNNKFIPRSIIVDLEPGTGEVIRESDIGGIFKDKNFINGANGAGNNWAKGHYTEGAELVEEVLDCLRKTTEACDSPQGFQLMHSLGGGTGSGMGTLLLLKIRDNYPDRITCSYSIFPSPKVSDTVVEPYNAVLSSHQLLENADETFLVDNEALYNIHQNVLKKPAPTYADMNSLIAQVVCGITASLRFPGQLNGDLRKLGVNLVPFPRLHFFLVSQAPLISAENQSHAELSVKSVAVESFSDSNFFSNVKPDDGKYLASSYTFRGKMSSSDVDTEVQNIQDKNEEAFTDWIPNNIKSSVVNVAPKTSDLSATFVANSTALKGIFQRLATQFGKLYKRKAFLHWYKGEGMDEMEFQEADKNVRDLITEYQDKQDAIYEGEEEDEESGAES